MTVSEYLLLYHEHDVRPAAKCGSGLVISIQASKFHYCLPCRDFGPYTEVEVGYPSIKPDELEKYREAGSEVYPYVPIEVLEELIAANGGIVGPVEQPNNEE